MSELKGQGGVLSMVVTVTRKATGKVETHRLTGVVEGEDTEKAQRMVAEINQPKEQDDGTPST